MAGKDVQALSVISEQINAFKTLKDLPQSLAGVENYKTKVNQVLKVANSEILRVKSYIENVEKKIEELRDAQRILIKSNQDAIESLFKELRANARSAVISTPTASTDNPIKYTNKASNHSKEQSFLLKLQLAHELQTTAKEMMIDKLSVLLQETEAVCANLKNGAQLCGDDFDQLQGCLQNWKDVQEYNATEKDREKKRLEEMEKEKKVQEEIEKKKKKQDEIEREKKRQEEIEKEKKRQEEIEKERKRQEEIEKERKRQEEIEKERKRQEEIEEERKRQMEIEREKKRQEEIEKEKKRQEEIEREKKRQEEIEKEKKRQDEIEKEKKRQEEIEMKRKQEEARRGEERKEKENLQKEAEERAWRHDHNNWTSVTYSRASHMVDGRRAYHSNIACVMASPPDNIEKDDLECSESDEVNPLIEILDPGERIISSLTSLQSRKGNLHSEVATRIYIPYFEDISSRDEIFVKISLNGNEWITVAPLPATSHMKKQDKLISNLAGVEINDFNSFQAVVVARPKCQTIIIDKPGVSEQSIMDKNVRLFVPRDAFNTATELKLMVQSVSDDTISSLQKEGGDFDNVLAASSIVTLLCEKRPNIAIEIDLKSTKSKNSGNIRRGKTYQLLKTKDKSWKFADVGIKRQQDDITVTLPPGRNKYTVMEIDVPASFPKDNVPLLAEALQKCINKTNVVLVVKQQEDDMTKCALRIVRREIFKGTIALLEQNGYTKGPDVSDEFSLYEGQKVEISFTGNIDFDIEKDTKPILTYLTYMGGASLDLSLRVKDSWKQKDLSDYIGKIMCNTLDGDGSQFDLVISLPKPRDQRTTINAVRVRLPYYLISLASFLASTLCMNDTWKTVLRCLLGGSKFGTKYRIASRKLEEKTDTSICKVILLDWLKEQAKADDKVNPILVALKQTEHGDVAESCVKFLRYQKEQMSDGVLIELAQGITKDVHTFGQDLQLDEKDIERCIKQHEANIKQQHAALLMAWRESEHAVEQGVNSMQYLKSICI